MLIETITRDAGARHAGRDLRRRRPCGCASATAAPSPSTSTRSCGPSAAAASVWSTWMRCGWRRRRSAGSTTAPPRASWTSSPSRPPPRSSWRSRSTRKLAARLLATYIDKEVRGQEIHAFSQSVAAARRFGLANDRLVGLRDDQCAQAQRRGRRRARPGVRVLRPAHGLRPLPPQASADPAGHRDTPAVLPAHRLRAGRDGAGGAGALPAVLVARVPAELADAVQRGHSPRAALELLPARLARRQPGEHLPALHGRGAALEVLGRHRPRLPSRARRAAR